MRLATPTPLILILILTTATATSVPTPTTITILPDTTHGFHHTVHLTASALVHSSSLTTVSVTAQQPPTTATSSRIPIPSLLLPPSTPPTSLPYDPFVTVVAAGSTVAALDHVSSAVSISSISPTLSPPLSFVATLRRRPHTPHAAIHNIALAPNLLIALSNTAVHAYPLPLAQVSQDPAWSLPSDALGLDNALGRQSPVLLPGALGYVAALDARGSQLAMAVGIRHAPDPILVIQLGPTPATRPDVSSDALSWVTVPRLQPSQVLSHLGITADGTLVVAAPPSCSHIWVISPAAAAATAPAANGRVVEQPPRMRRLIGTRLAPHTLLAVDCDADRVSGSSARAFTLPLSTEAAVATEPHSSRNKPMWFSVVDLGQGGAVSSVRAAPTGLDGTVDLPHPSSALALVSPANWLLTFATNAAFLPSVAAAASAAWHTDVVLGAAVVLSSSAYHWSDVAYAESVAGLRPSAWHQLDNVASIAVLQGLLLRVGPWAAHGPPSQLRLVMGLVALAAQLADPWALATTLTPLVPAAATAAWLLVNHTPRPYPRPDRWNTLALGAAAAAVVAFVAGLSADAPDFRWRHALWHVLMGTAAWARIRAIAPQSRRLHRRRATAGTKPNRSRLVVVASLRGSSLLLLAAAVTLTGSFAISVIGCATATSPSCASRMLLVSDAALVYPASHWAPVSTLLSAVATGAAGHVLAADLALGQGRAWMGALVRVCSAAAAVGLATAGLVSQAADDGVHAAATGLAAGSATLVNVGLAVGSVRRVPRLVLAATIAQVLVLATLACLHVRAFSLDSVLPGPVQLGYATVELACLALAVGVQASYARNLPTRLTLALGAHPPQPPPHRSWLAS